MTTTNPTDKAITTIYQTTNYDQFEMPKYTREVTPDNTHDLIQAFQHNDNIPPIEVARNPKTHKLTIIDGQRRYVAAKELHLPLCYYLTYLDDGDTTEGLWHRNHHKNWNCLDIIDSYAANPNNHTTTRQAPTIRRQYRRLQRLLADVYDLIGHVPTVPLIELAEGIDLALDQPNYIRKDYDWRAGNFTMHNQTGFLRVIKRIQDLQSQVADFRMSASMVRVLYAMCADDSLDIPYFAKAINDHQDIFTMVLTQNSSPELLQELIGFYNRYRSNFTARTIAPLSASMNANHKMRMKGQNFHDELFLK